MKKRKDEEDLIEFDEYYRYKIKLKRVKNMIFHLIRKSKETGKSI